jgi:hypothetical protein
MKQAPDFSVVRTNTTSAGIRRFLSMITKSPTWISLQYNVNLHNYLSIQFQ